MGKCGLWGKMIKGPRNIREESLAERTKFPALLLTGIISAKVLSVSLSEQLEGHWTIIKAAAF